MTSRPNLEEAIPAAGAKGHTVAADAQAAHPVLVSGEDTNALALERVPHVAVVVIIPGKEDSARRRECNRCHTAQDVVVVVRVKLAVGAKVKQAARSVIRASSKRVAVGEESDKRSQIGTY